MRTLLTTMGALVLTILVLGSCADDKRSCTTTDTRTTLPNGGYDQHYTRVCVDR